ncbi:hypothetical protein ACHAWF_005722, partial [Thalassiosira exigua]
PRSLPHVLQHPAYRPSSFAGRRPRRAVQPLRRRRPSHGLCHFPGGGGAEGKAEGGRRRRRGRGERRTSPPQPEGARESEEAAGGDSPVLPQARGANGGGDGRRRDGRRRQREPPESSPRPARSAQVQIYASKDAAARDSREGGLPHDFDSVATADASNASAKKPCVAVRAAELFVELGEGAGTQSAPSGASSPPASAASCAEAASVAARYRRRSDEKHHATDQDCVVVPVERFERIAKELCGFPTFFHKPLYDRILLLWCPAVTYGMFRRFWTTEMAPHDADERLFRLVKRPDREHIGRDDFFPYVRELLNDHPGLEFLSDHAEFQDKYAVTVVARIFYAVDRCRSGRITCRQVRKSDLVEVFGQVDEEEDINKVTRYFSYEHFYVLYCRFWELDHDRDYKITREDLLKYGEHSLSHMIVDRIFDAAPRPYEGTDNVAGYLTYEDFIFFMLSEEDKANEFSVRYWFACVDVDGDDRLNNMEMRSFYAVQLHRMQCMGHEVVPFEDMLCQMMDMIKPASTEYLVVEDFLRPHCSQVSGALFGVLFNVNKYVLFEQRDPFLERQKREDEFETDWDRFACIDYNRLAMEEEQREEEAMEVDWVTMDEEEEDGDEYNSMGLSGSSEAPF